MEIVKGFGGSRRGCGCDIIKVFELPISPGTEILAHLVSEDSDLACTLLAVRECPVLRHECSNPHLLGIYFLTGNLELVKYGTKLWVHWLT